MSYNDVGLKTAKGSSTSGHVQRSLANNNDSRKLNYNLRQREKSKASSSRIGKDASKTSISNTEPQKNFLKHMSKREIEVTISELRDKLEDEDVEEDTIERECEGLRQKLLKEWETERRLSNAYLSRAKRQQDDDGQGSDQHQE